MLRQTRRHGLCPPAKLRTPAGIDHDYNFLHGIELAVERNEKLLVGERALVQEEELRPLTVQEVKWKPGRDGRKRRVLMTRVLREAKGRVFERFLAQRLRKLNISIVCAPMGMARQKENHTTLNRRSGRINWQVEWMTLEAADQADERDSDDGNARPKTKRDLSKVMDDVPLYRAYHTLLEEHERAKSQLPKKIVRSWSAGHSQEAWNATWTEGLYTLQDPYTGAWGTCRGADTGVWPSKKEETQKQSFRYFLGGAPAPAGQPISVTQLGPDECFRDILVNTRILEFPTVYVLRGSDSLPSGFVLGLKDLASPPSNKKRKNPPGKKTLGKSAKRRRHGGKGAEEGEINSDEEGDDYLGAKGVALEVGDVIEEHSLGEDDSDDDTSSSGSDSDLD